MLHVNLIQYLMESKVMSSRMQIVVPVFVVLIVYFGLVTFIGLLLSSDLLANRVGI